MPDTNIVTNGLEAVTNIEAVSNTNSLDLMKSIEDLGRGTSEFFHNIVFKNTVKDFLISLGVFAIIFIVVFLLQRIVLRRLKKKVVATDTGLDDFIVKQIDKSVFPLLYYASVYIAARYLTLPDILTKILNVIGIVLVTIFMIRFVSSTVRYSINKYLEKREKDPMRRRTVQGLLPAINIIIWIIGIVFLLGNLGFDISAIVAGLGIGGIAVALAAQALLGDFFSYFSILFDRPFELGDFIILDDFMGTVEYIGVKTSRIRSLGGEQIVMSNTDLTSSRVRNYKRMETRRVLFKIGVTYNTPLDKLKKLPIVIKEIIEGIEKTRFDRAHFSAYGDSSLTFEIVYYVLDGDYNLYMDIQQEINLKIFETCEKEGIEFAFPTRTVYVKNEVEETK